MRTIRYALLIGLIACAPALAQTPAQSPVAPIQSAPLQPLPGSTQADPKPAEPSVIPAPPAAAPADIAIQPYQAPDTEVFGEPVQLRARPMLQLEGQAQWDSAFETLTEAFRKLTAAMKAANLSANGAPLTIYVTTDDRGFDFRAAIPLARLPDGPLPAGMTIGATPAGAGLRFSHKGGYEAMDSTYEAVTNWLEGRKLDAQDNFIEEYVTDPLTTPEDRLLVNIYVLLK